LALVLLAPGTTAAARLSGALKDEHALVQVSGWTAAAQSLSARNIEGAILDPYDSRGELRLRELGALRAGFPEAALILFADFTGREPDLFELGRLGMDGILEDRGFGATRELRDRTEGALDAALATRVSRKVSPRVRPLAARCLTRAVVSARQPFRTLDLARALSLSEKALGKALRSAHLPTARRFLLWGRLIEASYLLARPTATVEECAFRVRYSTAAALHRGFAAGDPGAGGMAGRRGCRSRRVEGEGAPRGRQEKGDVMRDVDHDRAGATGSAVKLPSPPRGPAARRLSLRARRRGAGLAGTTVLAAMACATGINTGPTDTSDPARDIPAIVDAPPLDRTHWGILALDAETGDTLFARDVERHFVPASNQKILVGVSSFGLLGPEFRFRTEFWVPSPLDSEGTARGGLVLRVSGDPTWSRRYHPSLPAFLDSVAAELFETGLRRVDGGVTVEAPGWDGMTREGTWMFGDIGTAYSALPSPAAIEEGTVRIEVTGGERTGANARARVLAPGRQAVLDAVLLGVPEPGGVRLDVAHGLDRITLRGSVRTLEGDTLTYASPTPLEDAADAWTTALRRAGIVVVGSPSIRWIPRPNSGSATGPSTPPPPRLGMPVPCTGPVPTCPGAELLLGFESPQLPEIVQGMLEPSQNWIAEQLLRALGTEHGEDGRASQGRAAAERFFVDEVGIDSTAIDLRDGSGLSAYDLVTPGAIIDLLQYAQTQPWGSQFRSALAAPGEEDSTLENRLASMEGRLEGKTGTITHVNSLSGYLRRDDGREIVFSILTNSSGLPSASVRRAMDEVVRVLARSR